MAYKSVDPALKMEAVKDHYSCSKISEPSMKYGVSLNSAYEWSRCASAGFKLTKRDRPMRLQKRRTVQIALVLGSSFKAFPS